MQAEVFVDSLNQCIRFTEEVRAPKIVGGPPRKAKVLDEKLTRQQVSVLLDYLMLAEGDGGVCPGRIGPDKSKANNCDCRRSRNDIFFVGP